MLACLLIVDLTGEAQVVRERPQAGRVLIRQRGPERVGLIPPPHHKVVGVRDHPRRVDLIRVDVVRRTILDRRNRRIAQVHRLLDRVARLVVFPDQVARFVVDVADSARRNIAAALDDPLARPVVQIAGRGAALGDAGQPAPIAIAVGDCAVAGQAACCIVAVGSRGRPCARRLSVAGRIDSLGVAGTADGLAGAVAVGVVAVALAAISRQVADQPVLVVVAEGLISGIWQRCCCGGWTDIRRWLARRSAAGVRVLPWPRMWGSRSGSGGRG